LWVRWARPWTDVLIISLNRVTQRRGQQIVFARDLINALRGRELDDTAMKLAKETGLSYRPSAEGEHVSGIYRQRLALSSGRFAVIGDGVGFQLVPWRPALEQQLGKQVGGVMAPGGNVEWSTGRRRGIGIRYSYGGNDLFFDIDDGTDATITLSAMRPRCSAYERPAPPVG
jgi:hypothetical protein